MTCRRSRDHPRMSHVFAARVPAEVRFVPKRHRVARPAVVATIVDLAIADLDGSPDGELRYSSGGAARVHPSWDGGPMENLGDLERFREAASLIGPANPFAPARVDLQDAGLIERSGRIVSDGRDKAREATLLKASGYRVAGGAVHRPAPLPFWRLDLVPWTFRAWATPVLMSPPWTPERDDHAFYFAHDGYEDLVRFVAELRGFDRPVVRAGDWDAGSVELHGACALPPAEALTAMRRAPFVARKAGQHKTPAPTAARLSAAPTPFRTGVTQDEDALAELAGEAAFLVRPMRQEVGPSSTDEACLLDYLSRYSEFCRVSREDRKQISFGL